MDMNNVNIEEIVKQVLAGMAGTAPAASASAAPAAPTAAPAGAIPKTAHVAVLTEKEHFDIKEYPIPAIGDDDTDRCGIKIIPLQICSFTVDHFNSGFNPGLSLQTCLAVYAPFTPSKSG